MPTGKHALRRDRSRQCVARIGGRTGQRYADHAQVSKPRRRALVRSGFRRVVRVRQPRHRRNLGVDPERCGRRCRPRRGGGARGVPVAVVARDDADGTRRDAAANRERARGARRRDRRDRNAGQRQAAGRGHRAVSLPAQIFPLLRGARRQDRGVGDSDRRAQCLQLHAARAASAWWSRSRRGIRR